MFAIVSFHTLGQAYYSPNILLNLETIFKFDNKKLMHEEPDNPLVNLSYAQDFGSLLYTPSNSPFGIPYGVWLAKYWDWWANIPKVQSPTQQNYQCYMHDAGDVVFLVNPLKMSDEVTYSCKIPGGKALFAALVTAEYDNGTEGYEKATDKQLKDATIQDDNSNAFKVMLDGKVISSDAIRNLRAESPIWNIPIVEGNHYDSPPVYSEPLLKDSLYF